MSDREVIEVKLSEAALDYIAAYYAEADADETLEEDAEMMQRGKTYLKATRRLLRDIARALEDFEDEIVLAALADDYENTNRAEFAEMSVRNCIRTAIYDIREAV